MKRLKRALLILAAVLLIWAVVNPYFFTFQQYDADAQKAFSSKRMNITLGDYKFKESNLHYARIGDTTKTVLLFLHGSPGCWNFCWDYFMDSTWQKDYELISIDRPGFGLSDYGQAKNLFEQSEIITSFVKHKLPNRRIELVGHSYGGPLVLQLCSDADSLYSKCYVIAGSVSPKAEEDEWQLNIFSSPLLKWMVPGSFKQGIEELLWLKEDLKNYEKALREVTTPIIAIHGLKDKMVPYEPNMLFMKKVFRDNLRIERIEDGNHFLPFNKYDKIKEILYQE